MILEACCDPSPYDIVLVHSLSRFFRDPVDQGLYKRRLEEHDVLLKSITQHFGDGAQANLIQTVIAACDAHNSAENAKHVSRSMIENARQGFWNGSRPPLGYCTYVAEQRGFTTQTGKAFYTSSVYEILRRTAYIGAHYFNKRDSRTGKVRPREEWVPLETPVIIAPELFETVQKTLEARSPKKIAPRLGSGPINLGDSNLL